MTDLAVGGWFASAFISKLVDKACSYLVDQYKHATSVHHKLKCLEEDLRKIQTVLHEADQRNIENPPLKDWLLDLKDAAYDADDVLDMFEYKILEDKVEGKGQMSSSTSHRLFKRARTTVENILFPNDDLNKLGDIVDRFRIITKDMGPLIELISSQPTVSLMVEETMRLRETTSMPIESQLFGRDSERSHLLQLLFETGDNEGASSNKNVHVLPIVGIGGAGKTTLVQEVYNDQNVKNHFDLQAWVCVSDDFDVKRLTKEIIESAHLPRPGDLHNLQNLDSTAGILKRGLTRKRFLIVLDDVWNEVAKKWKVLWAILNSGKKGSRVIITTRIQKIADMMGTKEAMGLGGLPEKDYWQLFVNCAFGSENPDNHPRLKFFGKQIAGKLGGNPLAAKTVGAVLKYDLKEEHWREILERKLWQVNQQKDGIMPVLRLSYDYLPAHLKQCFVYCSLFPKDYGFAKDRLVRLWIAQGFIQPDGEKPMEEIGEGFFNELLHRSFLQKSQLGGTVIHDLLHDLAQYLSNGESFRAEDSVSDNRPIEILENVRHMYIRANNLSWVCNDKYARKHLRSLVIVGHCDISLDILTKLEGLRVLILVHLNQKLSAESFQKMLHLRYLEIIGKGGQTYELPESLCKLYHLQVIDLRFDVFWVISRASCLVLPRGVNRLINLRHIFAYTGKRTGMGTLTSLQELRFYVNQKEKGFEIRQLADMSHLRRLWIEGLESVESKEEASEAKLCQKGNLEELRLTWDTGRCSDGVLEVLQPHQDLKILAICGYSFNCPSWLNGNWLLYLNHIELAQCSSWKILPPMGHLPLLKTLFLHRMNSVRRIGPEFYGGGDRSSSNNTTYKAFPSLEVLDLVEMPELTEWCNRVEGLELFPHLSCLAVGGCPRLRGSLCLPSSPLIELSVLISEYEPEFYSAKEGFLSIACPSISRLKERIPWQKLASVKSMRFKDREMTTFPTELEGWFQHLNSLISLEIYDCKKLQSLSSLLINSLSSTLCDLSLTHCNRIQSLPEERLPSSLRKLVIDRCGTELAERCRKDGVDWYKIAHIPTIINPFINVSEAD